MKRSFFSLQSDFEVCAANSGARARGEEGFSGVRIFEVDFEKATRGIDAGVRRANLPSCESVPRTSCFPRGGDDLRLAEIGGVTGVELASTLAASRPRLLGEHR